MNIPSFRLAIGFTACMAGNLAVATENGADTFALGAEGFKTGNLPPPGVYLLAYYENYHASRFNDKHGKSLIPGFGVNVDAIVPRIVWMTETTIMGGLLGFSAVQPMLDLRVSQGGMTDQRQAMADFIPAVFLSWHNGNHHWATVMEAVVPTGDYDKNQMANAGKNYYTLRPLILYSYIQPNGWEFSTKASYNFNSTNHATDYHSGQYFAADYAAGYEIIPHWTIGLEGHAFKQLTSDRVDGSDIGFRGQEVAYGPGLHYQGQGWSLEAKYLKEALVENRPEGTSTWVKFVWAF
jgi:hypothetical protein